MSHEHTDTPTIQRCQFWQHECTLRAHVLVATIDGDTYSLCVDHAGRVVDELLPADVIADVVDLPVEHELSPVYRSNVCQLCRRVHPSTRDAAICASTHPRGTRAQRFVACPHCTERVFVGQTCVCGTALLDRSQLVVSTTRRPHDACQRSTPGCCVDHSACEHDCETW